MFKSSRVFIPLLGEVVLCCIALIGCSDSPMSEDSNGVRQPSPRNVDKLADKDAKSAINMRSSDEDLPSPVDAIQFALGDDVLRQPPQMLTAEGKVNWQLTELKKSFNPNSFGDILEESRVAQEGPDTHENELRKAIYHAVYTHRLTQAATSTIKLSGKIISDSGEPIDSVQVKLSKGIGLTGHSVNEESTVDHEFSIEAEASFLTIYFEKEGYYKDYFTIESPFKLSTNEVHALGGRIK